MSIYGTEKVLREMRKHKYGEDLLDIIRDFARLDNECEEEIAVATYYFCAEWHGGQNCPLYAALCQSPYTPGLCSGIEEGTLEEMVYEALNSFMENMN